MACGLSPAPAPNNRGMNRLPSLFVSHGAPTFALEPGLHGAQLRALGERLPRPAAIAVVSAHWQAGEVRVSTIAQPATVHDFGGFPAPLYQLRYPAPGAPDFARRALTLLQQAGWNAREDETRGLDHGAWVPLMHLVPAADIPVFQIAMPRNLDEAGALRLGQALAPLAEEGVLLIGSGSLTHNLYETRFGDPDAEPYVHAFANWTAAQLKAGRPEALRLDDAPAGRRAHPTSEHFLPLLVAAGAGGAQVEELDGGIEHGVLAMRSYAFA
jgi:4,5-DOPA dioxygenase extradiol